MHKGIGLLAIKFLGVIFTYLFSVIITRNLSITSAGEVFIILSLMSISITSSRMGLDSVLVRYCANFRGAYRFLLNQMARKYFVISLLLVSFSGAIYFASMFDVASLIKFPEYYLPFLVLTLVAVFNPILASIFQGFDFVYLSSILRGVAVNFVFCVLVLFLGLNDYYDVIYLLSWSYGISMSIALIFFIVKIPVYNKVTSNDDGIKVSYSLWLLSIVDVFVVFSPSVIIGFFSSTEEVALYSVAHRIALSIAIVLTIVNSLSAQKYAKLFNEGKTQALWFLFKKNQRITLLISFLVSSIVLIFKYQILNIFGPEYSSASNVLTVLCMAQLINACAGNVTTLITMTGNSDRLIFKVYSLCSVVYFTSGVYLSEIFGALGMAYSYVIYIVFVNAILLKMCKKLVENK